MRESVAELGEALAALGRPLVVRRGKVEVVQEDLSQSPLVGALQSHEETGNGWTFARPEGALLGHRAWYPRARAPAVGGLAGLKTGLKDLLGGLGASLL